MGETKWLPPFPLTKAIECKKAIDRFMALRAFGYNEEDALEDVYKWFPDLRPSSVAVNDSPE